MPKPRSTRFSRNVSVRVPHPLLRAIDRQAKRLDVPRSAILLHALEGWLADPPRRLLRAPVAGPRDDADEDANVFE